MPVNVTDFPTDKLGLPAFHYEQATFWVTMFAFAIALYAAYYAKRAFNTAEADLTISKQNLAVTQRIPDLVAEFEVVQAGGGGGTAGFPYVSQRNEVYARVSNSDKGERRCDSFYVEICVPIEAYSRPYLARLLDNGPLPQSERYFEVVTDTVLFPAGPSTRVRFETLITDTVEPRSIVIQYRMKDDFATYPKEGYHTATLTLPVRDSTSHIQPRDGAEGVLWNRAMRGHEWNEHNIGEYKKAFNALDAMPPMTSAERLERANEIAKTIF